MYCENVRKPMSALVAMYAFCGFPMTVATLPMLAETNTAMRYGIGSHPAFWQHLMTAGVISRTTASLSTSAERTADSIITEPSSILPLTLHLMSSPAVMSKNPHTSSDATRSIMPSSRRSMSEFT